MVQDEQLPPASTGHVGQAPKGGKSGDLENSSRSATRRPSALGFPDLATEVPGDSCSQSCSPTSWARSARSSPGSADRGPGPAGRSPAPKGMTKTYAVRCQSSGPCNLGTRLLVQGIASTSPRLENSGSPKPPASIKIGRRSGGDAITTTYRHRQRPLRDPVLVPGQRRADPADGGDLHPTNPTALPSRPTVDPTAFERIVLSPALVTRPGVASGLLARASSTASALERGNTRQGIRRYFDLIRFAQRDAIASIPGCSTSWVRPARSSPGSADRRSSARARMA